MKNFDVQAYGPVFAPLLTCDQRRPLDTGTPDVDARPALGKLTVDAAFANAQLSDRDMAACCIAGVWLLHDFLDESHTISQGIDTPSGSFWHAIMHRREGDFSNAKYWFRHVGTHPIFEKLTMRAGELAAEHGETVAGERLTAGNRWDPFAFVDLCQTAERGRDALRDLCLDIQQVEWGLLFDHCYWSAISR
ncbi:MAG TPA: hypothetical protein VGM76_16405 [Lacipirellulaceae bacterium]|jgi:hypothetical protein